MSHRTHTLPLVTTTCALVLRKHTQLNSSVSATYGRPQRVPHRTHTPITTTRSPGAALLRSPDILKLTLRNDSLRAVGAEYGRVRTHGLSITQTGCIIKLEVLHGALLPEMHINSTKKKKKKKKKIWTLQSLTKDKPCCNASWPPHVNEDPWHVLHGSPPSI